MFIRKITLKALVEAKVINCVGLNISFLNIFSINVFFRYMLRVYFNLIYQKGLGDMQNFLIACFGSKMKLLKKTQFILLSKNNETSDINMVYYQFILYFLCTTRISEIDNSSILFKRHIAV